MEDKSKLIALIGKYVNVPYREPLIDNIKPAIRFKTELYSHCEMGTSKFGGLPDLPESQEWPLNGDGYPLSFIAQVNIKEIKRYDEGNKLPLKGMLFFFLDFSDLSLSKVLYFKDDECIKRTNVPLPNEQPKPSFFSFFKKSKPSFKIVQEAKIIPSLDYTIPSDDSLFYERIRKQHGLTAGLDNSILDHNGYFDELLDEGERVKSCRHQMLGYYRGIQNEYLEWGLENEKYKYIGKMSLEEVNSLMKWKLLFQVDSDDDLGFWWADRGKLLFFIKEEDLYSGEFSNVKLFLDTT